MKIIDGGKSTEISSKVNEELVIELEKILSMAKAGEFQYMAGIFVRDKALDSCDLKISSGISLMWLAGMLQRFVHEIFMGKIK